MFKKITSILAICVLFMNSVSVVNAFEKNSEENLYREIKLSNKDFYSKRYFNLLKKVDSIDMLNDKNYDNLNSEQKKIVNEIKELDKIGFILMEKEV